MGKYLSITLPENSEHTLESKSDYREVSISIRALIFFLNLIIFLSVFHLLTSFILKDCYSHSRYEDIKKCEIFWQPIRFVLGLFSYIIFAACLLNAKKQVLLQKYFKMKTVFIGDAPNNGKATFFLREALLALTTVFLLLFFFFLQRVIAKFVIPDDTALESIFFLLLLPYTFISDFFEILLESPIVSWFFIILSAGVTLIVIATYFLKRKYFIDILFPSVKTLKEGEDLEIGTENTLNTLYSNQIVDKVSVKKKSGMRFVRLVYITILVLTYPAAFLFGIATATDQSSSVLLQFQVFAFICIPPIQLLSLLRFSSPSNKKRSIAKIIFISSFLYCAIITFLVKIDDDAQAESRRVYQESQADIAPIVSNRQQEERNKFLTEYESLKDSYENKPLLNKSSDWQEYKNYTQSYDIFFPAIFKKIDLSNDTEVKPGDLTLAETNGDTVIAKNFFNFYTDNNLAQKKEFAKSGFRIKLNEETVNIGNNNTDVITGCNYTGQTNTELRCSNKYFIQGKKGYLVVRSRDQIDVKNLLEHDFLMRSILQTIKFY